LRLRRCLMLRAIALALRVFDAARYRACASRALAFAAAHVLDRL